MPNITDETRVWSGTVFNKTGNGIFYIICYWRRTQEGTLQGKGNQKLAVVEKTAFRRQVLLLRERVFPKRAQHGPYSPTDTRGEINKRECCACMQGLQQQKKAYASHWMGGIPWEVKRGGVLGLQCCSIRQEFKRGLFPLRYYFVSRTLPAILPA